MIVFKGFNSKMACTLGRGTYQYRIGRTEKTSKAKTAHTGFHSTREPFGILKYYHNLDEDTFCICEAGGDINEDSDGRVSSTELKPLKKLTPVELALYEAMFIEKHPCLETNYVSRNSGRDNGYFAIVRGKDPIGYGSRGSTIILLQECRRSKEIKKIVIFEISGENRPGWYGVGGKRDEKRNAEKTEDAECDTGDRKKSKE